METIRRCDIEKDYIFISYSSKDKEIVWADVEEFQRRGYNVWLDEANLDKMKPSWRDDAIQAIGGLNCRLVIFYVSRNSLTSQPCYNEMKATVDARAMMLHAPSGVPFIAVDVEEIGDLLDFRNKMTRAIKEATDISTADKEKKIVTAHEFIADFFNSNNERVRIKCKAEKNRFKEYYSEITSYFDESTLVNPPAESQDVGGEGKPVEITPDSINQPIDQKEQGEAAHQKGQEGPQKKEESQAKKHKAVNVKQAGERELPVITDCPVKITREMTLREFAALFADDNFVLYLRNMRASGGSAYSKQMVDYLMAALLRGCDIKAEEGSAEWKYCTIAVASKVDLDNLSLGASQFTWQSNARKAVEIEGSGKLGENSTIFAQLSENTTIGDVEQRFIRAEKGFATKDNEKVLNALKALVTS